MAILRRYEAASRKMARYPRAGVPFRVRRKLALTHQASSDLQIAGQAIHNSPCLYYSANSFPQNQADTVLKCNMAISPQQARIKGVNLRIIDMFEQHFDFKLQDGYEGKPLRLDNELLTQINRPDLEALITRYSALGWMVTEVSEKGVDKHVWNIYGGPSDYNKTNPNEYTLVALEFEAAKYS